MNIFHIITFCQIYTIIVLQYVFFTTSSVTKVFSAVTMWLLSHLKYGVWRLRKKSLFLEHKL